MCKNEEMFEINFFLFFLGVLFVFIVFVWFVFKILVGWVVLFVLWFGFVGMCKIIEVLKFFRMKFFDSMLIRFL